KHDSLAGNGSESWHTPCKRLPDQTKQDADGHAIEETRPCGFWRCRFSVCVEPDDPGLLGTATADRPHRCIAVAGKHEGKNPPSTTFPDPLGNFASQLECGTDFCRMWAVQSYLHCLKWNLHFREKLA